MLLFACTKEPGQCIVMLKKGMMSHVGMTSDEVSACGMTTGARLL